MSGGTTDINKHGQAENNGGSATVGADGGADGNAGGGGEGMSGAGFYGNGASTYSPYYYELSLSFINGGNGGKAKYHNGDGGFGGGGSHGNTHGGGGGGYSGGGGSTSSPYVGGGGGSFSRYAQQPVTKKLYSNGNDGPGKVVISRVGA